MPADLRAHAPATARNRDAILAVLREILPTAAVSQPDSGLERATARATARATVLEIGSGSGEHAVYFAEHFRHLDWLPTETSEAALGSIKAWLAHSQSDNILPPVTLEANRRPWPIERAAAILAINVIHYSPWETTSALLEGAAQTLTHDGVLYLYGPYLRNGVHTAPSNETFDVWLKARNSTFGVRDLQAVELLANERGLKLTQVTEMPANNLSLVFRRAE